MGLLDGLLGTTDPMHLAVPTRLRVLRVMTVMQGAYPTFHISSIYRTAAQQDALYAMGRTTPSPWPCVHDSISRPVGTCTRVNFPVGTVHPFGAVGTSLRGGQSAHNWRLACDMYPPLADPNAGDYITRYGLPKEAWSFYWRTAQSVGLRILGSGDPGHLEEPGFLFLGPWALAQFGGI